MRLELPRSFISICRDPSHLRCPEGSKGDGGGRVLSVFSETKQIEQWCLNKRAVPWFTHNLLLNCPRRSSRRNLGESEMGHVPQRFDSLTLDEPRMTGIETLHIVHGLVRNMKLVMDGCNRSSAPPRLEELLCV